MWLLFAPLCRITDSPQWLLYAARVIDLVFAAELLVALHRLVSRLVPAAAGWATLLAAASFTFARNLMVVRRPLMAMLLVVGLDVWVDYMLAPRLKRAALAGLCFGLPSRCCRRRSRSSVWSASRRSRSRSVRRRRELFAGLAVAAGVAAVPIAALVAWMCAIGVWREFWLWNYDFNRYFYTQATLAEHFSIVDSMTRVVLDDVALWLFGVAGLVMWLRRARGAWAPPDDARVVIAVALLGYLVALAFNRFPFPQYFIVAIPLWAPFAAEVLARSRAAVAACCDARGVRRARRRRRVEHAGARRSGLRARAHDAGRPRRRIAAEPPDLPRGRVVLLVQRRAHRRGLRGLRARPRHRRCGARRVAAAGVRLPRPALPVLSPYRWRDRAAGFTPTPIPDLLAPRAAASPDGSR